VLTDPDEGGNVVYASFTTRRPMSDETVIIRPGEHPFITRETVVMFKLAKLRPSRNLDMAVNQSLIRLLAAAGPALLLRIQRGALDSPHTPENVRRAVRSFLG